MDRLDHILNLISLINLNISCYCEVTFNGDSSGIITIGDRKKYFGNVAYCIEVLEKINNQLTLPT